MKAAGGRFVVAAAALAVCVVLALGAWRLFGSGPGLGAERVLAPGADTQTLVAPSPAPGAAGAVAFASLDAPGVTIRFADGSTWKAHDGKLGEHFTAWSPDGRYLAFRTEADPDRIPRALALVVADIETRRIERVSDHLEGLGRPAWRATKSGQVEVYAPLGPAGIVRRVFPSTPPPGFPSVFVYERGGEIWVEAEGEAARQISRGGGYAPLLSPDGTRVLWSWGDDIYMAALADAPALARDPVAKGVSPCWSPSGDAIAFCRVLDTGHEGEGQTSDIFLLDLARPGASPVAVTATPDELEVELAWPEPDRIVYSVRNDGSIREARIRR